MRLAERTLLRRELEQWRLSDMDGPKKLRELKEKVITGLGLDPCQVEAMGQNYAEIAGALLDYLDDDDREDGIG